jgi:hypothetical protein
MKKAFLVIILMLGVIMTSCKSTPREVDNTEGEEVQIDTSEYSVILDEDF